MNETTIELMEYAPWLVVVVLAYWLTYASNSGIPLRKRWVKFAYFFVFALVAVFSLLVVGDDVGLFVPTSDYAQITPYGYVFAALTIRALIQVARLKKPHNKSLQDDAEAASRPTSDAP